MKITHILTLGTIILLLSACSSTRTSKMENSPDLFKNKWTLTHLNGHAVQEGTYQIPFLEFSKGDLNRVSGNSSCNLLSGSFTLKSGKGIDFSQLASTRKACLGENIENEFLEMMGKVNHYELMNDELSLLDGKNVLAVFKAGGDTASLQELPQELTGTWKLNYISGKRIAFEGLYPEDAPTLSFSAENPQSVAGNTSCNVFNSQMKITDSTINISGPGLMTMRACPGEGEQTFMQMLKKVNRYSVNENTLTLLMDDVAVMRFEKQ